MAAAGAVPAACVCHGLTWRGAAEAFCVGRASLLPVPPASPTARERGLGVARGCCAAPGGSSVAAQRDVRSHRIVAGGVAFPRYELPGGNDS